jgi:hypothetical protein
MIRKKVYFFAFVLFIFLQSNLYGKILKIADFDRGEKPNLIKGDYGAWNKTEWDRSQFCNESITSDPRIVYGGRGCSLALDYDIDSPNRPAYNGFWMRLEKIDLSKYKYLAFYIKGDEKVGFPEKIKAEIKNMNNKIASFIIDGITSEWKKVIIPLDEMNKNEDFSESYEFTLVFDDSICDVKVGRVYIDEFYLSNDYGD